MATSPLPRRRCTENDTIVLDVLKSAERPLSAYDIVERTSLRGARMVAQQVYRTLARLVAHRVVRRIETLGAYILRNEEGNVCLICRDCRAIEYVELPQLEIALAAATRSGRFNLTDSAIEAQGQCGACRRSC